MTGPARILYVDDYVLDRELIRDALEKESDGFIVTEASSHEEFIAKLALDEYDLVLSDFNILGYEGLQIIDVVHAHNPTMPIIIVTGTGSEEIAVEALKHGAADYIIKTPHHIRRLPQTILSVIEKRDLQRERDRLFNYSIDLLSVIGFDGCFKQLNPAWETTLGWRLDEMLSKFFLEFIHPDDRLATLEITKKFERGEQIYAFENRYLCKDGSYRWLSWNATPNREEKLVFSVASDITERKITENQIRELNADLERRVQERTLALEQANKELESFSYSVSHDLRAPLRVIEGYAQIIASDYAPLLGDDGQRLFSAIQANTQKMSHLITDLLAFSRVGRIAMNFLTVDMTHLAQTIYNEIQPSDEREPFDFQISELPPAYGDPVLLRQVWSNLISNAIKYTRPKDQRRIEIGGYLDKSMRVYYVKDTGVGFDPNYAYKLFGVFQRLHSSEEFEGSGVGLAIVQQIVKRHGGAVWAEGQLQQGATFYFSLPD
jgi:PAS domain S-box-containing protein